MSPHINKPDILPALEAQWAAVIDRRYFYSWHYNAGYVSDPIAGPTYAMWKCVQFISYNYEQNNPAGVVADVPRLAMIARHICPIRTHFERWLSDVVTKSTALFPFSAPALDPAIPRQFFFEPDYDYATADNAKNIRDFLSTLDYQHNEFLNSPATMKEKGFAGTPYRF